jgi:thymidylate kinase
MDVFDSIQNSDDGALKFSDYVPEKLSETSNIDLVIDKKEAKKVLQFLKNHHLVNRVSVEKKSFMYALQAVLTDGNILAIDLLWQLKVRNLEIMNAQEVYKNNPVSPFGVRQVPAIVSARFTALFYLLNNAKVPSRYSRYLPLLEKSQNALDLQITHCINENRNEQSRLLQFIKKNPNNQSFSYIKNMVFYVLDAIKSYTNNSGYIITFSGVDGAGKSTVIEQIAERIQKQLRKPVVVLHHRPSILPILSVWTKEKEKAEMDAISSLPRQGKNNNPISSLIRFSYYYLDYIIGQFVVYFKYIIRGYVVVYDRDYFDFINDCKRSNIVLPHKLKAFGYRFLMQPDYNFFLFADAAVILNRKQELNKNPIEELTTDYKQLFEQLQSKDKSNVYQSINNADLDVTLSKVFQTITMNHKSTRFSKN